ncbi:MAG: ATP-binding cassette domain-containing protein [Clostridia bacterium]|nr:ATP-binding cassette domain-containing protein [Clostridia bacterium]MDH7573100.1 ATP-binding cassette domain-containing protein [Clostridia bacterium]
MVEATNLTVFYENALALNRLSLRVDHGEVVGVFGPNGAGKSTLMLVISGILQHLRYREQRRGGERIAIYGELQFEGEDILEASPVHRVKRGIVLCRERHPVFRESSVIENLKISGYLQSRSAVRERIELVFSLFPRLKDLKGRRAGMLSGGEQQMLAIGMALVAGPRLLLLDEPLLGLSPAIQSEVVRGIRNIREQGITVLVTEQYARPLMPVIDRGYVIENGNLVLAGTREELLDNPEVKAAYLGW